MFSTRNLFCFIYFIGLSFQSLQSYPIPLGGGSPEWKACEKESKSQFMFSSLLFNDEKKDLLLLEKVAKVLGNERYSQSLCLKNLKLSPEDRERLQYYLENYRDTETELLQYNVNLLNWSEKQNSLSYSESQILKEFIIAKMQIYALLFRRTMDVVFIEEKDWKEEVFASIYLSSLRLHYEFLKNLSPKTRKILLKKIHGD
jgi:hypothetical protein